MNCPGQALANYAQPLPYYAMPGFPAILAKPSYYAQYHASQLDWVVYTVIIRILRMIQSNARNSIPGIYRESKSYVSLSLNLFTLMLQIYRRYLLCLKFGQHKSPMPSLGLQSISVTPSAKQCILGQSTMILRPSYRVAIGQYRWYVHVRCTNQCSE